MLSAIAVVENRSCRVLLRRASRGTSSSTLALRLRPCFNYQRFDSGCPTSQLRKFHGSPSLHYATAPPPPSLLSRDAVAYMQLLLARSDANVPHSTAAPPSLAPTYSTVTTESPTPAGYHIDSRSAGPFRKALLALQEGNARRLLIHLNVIKRMSPEDLRDAVATLPRTTFTEFFRALDPLRVARDCDPAGEAYISVGMYKMLYMDSSIDEWGVRRLFTGLLQQFLPLMHAMKMAGYTLHMEEYIALIRCAGACSDISGARALWTDLITGPAVAWQNSEVYTEYIQARFVTEPLYTNYWKLLRMVTPRNLHRSRVQLRDERVRRLDNLHYGARKKRGLFGLNKDVDHVEELGRLLRRNGVAMRLFREVVSTHSFRINERLLCALMIALGRSGLMRLVGASILQKYFGIKTPHPIPPQQWDQRGGLSSGPPRIVPTVRLMRAVVETYCSNAEIAVAIQLVEYLSTTYKIAIPPDVWQDLLEWTYIMSTPPTSTGWRRAGLLMKIPSAQGVEMIWNAMTAPPHNHIPTFQNYNLVIRSLIGRLKKDPTPALTRMREALALYDEQCREYEAAVFEYVHHLRDGVAPSATIHRFESARFKKQDMWYDISVWCRMILKRTPFSETNPIPHPLTPAFIEEFRPFLKNPIEYPTPTGRVRLTDPALESFRVSRTGFIEKTFLSRNVRGMWMRRRLRIPKFAVLSSHSLARFKPTRSPLTLIAPNKYAFKDPVPRPVPRPQPAA
ncbi:mitochondrial ATPase expression-domain-containing protein [Nemania serpens]|nr:mitochondrial ATPase expression-domain-containing protein [Nemania serpens]